MTRLLMLMTSLAAATPAMALDRARPPCPATEVAPGVKMRNGTCPLMYLPIEPEQRQDPFGRPAPVAGPWAPSGTDARSPALPVRQPDLLPRP